VNTPYLIVTTEEIPSRRIARHRRGGRPDARTLTLHRSFKRVDAGRPRRIVPSLLALAPDASPILPPRPNGSARTPLSDEVDNASCRRRGPRAVAYGHRGPARPDGPYALTTSVRCGRRHRAPSVCRPSIRCDTSQAAESCSSPIPRVSTVRWRHVRKQRRNGERTMTVPNRQNCRTARSSHSGLRRLCAAVADSYGTAQTLCRSYS